MIKFFVALGTGISEIFKEVWKFLTDLFQDFEDHWDLKPLLGFCFVVFGGWYVGFGPNHGDIAGFLAIEGVGCFLLGWAASPWGAGNPNVTKIVNITQAPIVTPTSTPTIGGTK